MFKKARFVLNLLQNYKKNRGKTYKLFREILYFLHKDKQYFCIQIII